MASVSILADLIRGADMWSGGIVLWMPVVWVGLLLLAVWMAWVVRGHPLVAGGVVLILIELIGTSTAGVCAIPAHREAGMMGRLVVGPGN